MYQSLQEIGDPKKDEKEKIPRQIISQLILIEVEQDLITPYFKWVNIYFYPISIGTGKFRNFFLN